jgi:hypothetical protein
VTRGSTSQSFPGRIPDQSIWVGSSPGGQLPTSFILIVLNGGFMTNPIVLASSALAVVLVLALIREVRLRRALQTLLRRLLKRWRSDRHE